MTKSISYDQAISLLSEHAKLRTSQNEFLGHECPTLDSLGYISCETILNDHEYLPAFNNSAMDGFALNSNDTVTASEQTPCFLKIVGESSAGNPAKVSNAIEPCCYSIMTGGVMPADKDSIVKVEDVIVRDNYIELRNPVPPKQFIRFCGEDFAPGDQIMPKGHKINAHDILMCSSLGKSKIKVYPKIKIIILSTGNEIQDNLNIPLAPGHIRNSTSPYLISAFNEAPFEVEYLGNIKDDPEKIKDGLKTALDKKPHLIITTGGVSAGKYDYIPKICEALGGKTMFHKVAIKPGRPIFVSDFFQSNNTTLFFGLPGNPISTDIGLEFFIKRYIQYLTGQLNPSPFYARATETISVPKNLRFFIKGHVKCTKNAQLEVAFHQKQGSAQISPLKETNAWIVANESIEKIKEGDMVPFYYYPSSIYGK